MKTGSQLLKKLSIFSAAIVLVLMPFLAFADINTTANGTVTAVGGDGTLTISVENATTSGNVQSYTYSVKPTSGSYAVGDQVTFTLLSGKPVASTVKPGLSSQAQTGLGSQQQQNNSSQNYSAGSVQFRLFPNLSCSDNDAIRCWVREVYQFSQYAILILATAVLIIAGILYMTSAGNPKQVAQAKKLIIGALSGVAVMVLGRFFLNVVLGLNVPF